jgi:hypothetical protein
MSIVISYAHEDSDFVDNLAGNLFKNRVHVWLDRWELKVGDSILRAESHNWWKFLLGISYLSCS